VSTCPFCGPTVFVRLNVSEAGLRCVRCSASTVHLSLGLALRSEVPGLSRLAVCELSARGPLAGYLRRTAHRFSGSEYFDGAPPGELVGGIPCQDVQALTYPSQSFDVVTHTEVLEHVPDDARAFAELYRILRPGGIMLFTVPLSGLDQTIDRARLHEGEIEHLLEPVYHADPQRPSSGISAFRDYGRDIVERLNAAGFTGCAIHGPRHAIPWLHAREVIVGHRPQG